MRITATIVLRFTDWFSYVKGLQASLLLCLNLIWGPTVELFGPDQEGIGGSWLQPCDDSPSFLC